MDRHILEARPATLAAAVVLAWLICFAGSEQAAAQIFVGDSGVGYIDSALPANVFRFQYDSAYGIDKPNRAEFLWAWPPPDGPGPGLDETNVNYQGIAARLEWAPRDDFSVFAELPVLALDPEVLTNTSGLSDASAGFKWAFHSSECQTTTFQLRAYAPTGDASSGLGNRHPSLEPALLWYRRLPAFASLESELRYFTPVNGTPDVSGSLFRYGVGVTLDGWRTCDWRARPVVELVGWTVLDGRSRFALTPGGPPIVEEAGGDTIVNVKAGARVDFGGADDIYVGYGRALTNERWYGDIIRLEWRRAF